jgi:3-isopropylmalate/(R)-2-methylmalate dehydratase large subunit
MQALEYWKTLQSDEGAHFDKVIVLDAAKLPPIVTWGSSPEDVVSVQGIVPNPDDIADENKRTSKHRALDYMGLKPAPRSPTSRSTACSSAPAPTAASRICAP